MVRLALAIGVAVMCFGGWLSAQAQQEPARLALLIGNKDYTSAVGALTNPHNDVSVVAASLKQIGSKTADVTLLTEQRRSQILTAVDRFAGRLAAAGPGAIGFLYYSPLKSGEREEEASLSP
jgi:predicted hotdog family 3-hydroxylacyl-ACP dehydratase